MPRIHRRAPQRGLLLQRIDHGHAFEGALLLLRRASRRDDPGDGHDKRDVGQRADPERDGSGRAACPARRGPRSFGRRQRHRHRQLQRRGVGHPHRPCHRPRHRRLPCGAARDRVGRRHHRRSRKRHRGRRRCVAGQFGCGNGDDLAHRRFRKRGRGQGSRGNTDRCGRGREVERHHRPWGDGARRHQPRRRRRQPARLRRRARRDAVGRFRHRQPCLRFRRVGTGNQHGGLRVPRGRKRGFGERPRRRLRTAQPRSSRHARSARRRRADHQRERGRTLRHRRGG